jgi:hypothetical protein
MAEAWLANVKMLRGIDLSNKSTHLLYLEDALAAHDRKDVVKALKAMSSREFKDWATGRKPDKPEELPEVALSISQGEIALDGTPLLELDEDLPDEERDFIGKLLRAGYRARAGHCLAHVVAVYDEGEAWAVDRFLKDLRASK